MAARSDRAAEPIRRIRVRFEAGRQLHKGTASTCKPRECGATRVQLVAILVAADHAPQRRSAPWTPLDCNLGRKRTNKIQRIWNRFTDGIWWHGATVGKQEGGNASRSNVGVIRFGPCEVRDEPEELPSLPARRQHRWLGGRRFEKRK